ncbi:ribosomal protein L21 isoform X2 [Wolffia australiana]
MAATRRCFTALYRCSRSLLLPSTRRGVSHPAICSSDPFLLPDSDRYVPASLIDSSNPSFHRSLRHFSSRKTESSDEEEDDEDDDYGDEESVGEVSDEDGDGGVVSGPSRSVVCGKSEEEKTAEAEDIGYRVLGPLDSTEKPFKPWEPVFAVVQIGSHQFKVCNGDSVFTERLKYCEVNDKLVLNKVLMLGSKTQTIIGRPMLPEAAVHAVVEEHELTKLRITDIHGIDKFTGAGIPA